MNKTVDGKANGQPVTRAARWALWLGLGSLLALPLLGGLNAFLRPLLDPTSVNPNAQAGFGGGFFAAIVSLALAAATLVCGVRAFRLGERSWMMWVGLLIGALVALLWLALIAANILYPH